MAISRKRRNAESDVLLSASQFVTKKTYSQSHLLNQMKEYYNVNLRGHRSLASTIGENIKKGSCKGFSFMHGFVRLRNEKVWWRKLLTVVKEWDGNANSLDELVDTKRLKNEGEVAITGDLDAYIQTDNVIHCGVGFPVKLTRRQIFEIVTHNVMLAQTQRYTLIDGDKLTKYRFGSEIQYRDNDGEHHTLGSGYYIVGNFNFERLSRMITDPAFLNVFDDSMCLVYSNTHVCEFTYNKKPKAWEFFDSNFGLGKAHRCGGGLEGLKKLFCELDASLGTEKDDHPFDELKNATIDLCFEIVTGTEAFELDPFRAYYELLEQNPYDLLKFNNRIKHGMESNFADKLFTCDEHTVNMVLQSIKKYHESSLMLPVNLHNKQKKVMIDLIMSAVHKRDINRFIEYVNVCYDRKVLSTTLCKKINEVIQGQKRLGEKSLVPSGTFNAKATRHIKSRNFDLLKMEGNLSSNRSALFTPHSKMKDESSGDDLTQRMARLSLREGE